MKEFVKNISISKAIFHMIILLLLIMFIRQSMYSVQRYLDKKTNFDNTREVPNTIFDILLIIFKKKQEEEFLLYPSISVCKKYSIEQENLFVANISGVGNETDISRVVGSIENQYKEGLGLEKQIFFFTQPGAMNMTYPCTTTHGGSSPGRPCIFPIYLTMQNKTTMYSGCINGDIMEIPYSGCFTKVSKNNSINIQKEIDQSWGYCPKLCEGQTISPQSPFNLAIRSNENLWTSKFYDFSVWEYGFCHTYDPPGKSDPDYLNRIYFMIANNPDYLNQNYKIFIHERGQFWPRYNMMSFGQPDPLTLSPNRELDILSSPSPSPQSPVPTGPKS